MDTHTCCHENNIECNICYTTQKTFTDCAQCLKKVCSTCFSKLRRLRCPYCRHEYMDDSVFDDDENDDESVIILDEEEEKNMDDWFAQQGFRIDRIPIPPIRRESDRTQRRPIPEDEDETEEEYDDSRYNPQDRYFDMNQGIPDILQEFRNGLRSQAQENIINLANEYVSDYITGHLDLDSLLSVLQHAKQLHR